MNTTSVNEIDPTSRAVLVTLFSFSSVAGSIGNTLSMYCLWKANKTMGSAVKLLMALNAGETVSCVFITSYQGFAIYKNFTHLAFGYLTLNILCAIASWYSSIIMFLIALNRYIQTKYIRRHNFIFSKSRVAWLIAVTSLFCFVVPLHMYTGIYVYAAIIDQLISITIMISMPTLYVLLYKRMMQAHRRVCNAENNRFTLKVLRNVLILISEFYIFRLPTFLITILYLFFGKERLNFLLMTRIGSLCISISACVNPVVYVLLDKSYHNVLKNLLCSCKRKVESSDTIQCQAKVQKIL